MTEKFLAGMVALSLGLLPASPVFAAKKRASRTRYKTPITHPVILWARTLSASDDIEQKKVAAFKLSQYSQPIYQEEAITSLTNCMKGDNAHLKVLCAKAMGKAGNQSRAESIRKVLLEVYKNDPTLRDTLVRTFTVRKDGSKSVQDALLETLQASTNSQEALALLNYFQQSGEGLRGDTFIEVFKRFSDDKVRRAAVKVLAEHASGEPQVVDLLAVCAESMNTPLALNCLAGLQLQARKDSTRTWAALEKTLESSDPDVLLATLDVINVLPENPNPKIAKRLIEIIAETDDTDILDKSVLALGVAGDHTQPIVDTLFSLMSKSDTEEGTKIHVALVMGRQADLFPD